MTNINRSEISQGSEISLHTGSSPKYFSISAVTGVSVVIS